jgi:hypothetical protein
MAQKQVLVKIKDLFEWNILEPGASDESFVAVCPRLGISVESPDRDRLPDVAKEALRALFADLELHNDAIRYLLKHGIQIEIFPIPAANGSFVIPAPAITTESESQSASPPA